jgi:APA family basic amino acid/polyamine antiporter
MSIFRKKDFNSVKEAGANSKLAKTLTAFDLVMLGLGGIIGAGLFAYTGLIAAEHSGPAVMISYMIAGTTCLFVALTYTELASMLPTSGSIYTYSFVAFGELAAWMAGGIIILEFTVSGAAVAKAWSSYMRTLLHEAGYTIPEALSKIPSEGGMVDILAVLIVAIVTAILYKGTKDSKRINTLLVFIKLFVIALFIILAVPSFDIKNWSDFMPYGFNDVFLGASVLFFAFTGFGAIAASAEECKNPERDITIGLIGSVILSTFIYVIASGLLTGIVSYKVLNNPSSFAYALSLNGKEIGSAIVAAGAICGLTTVIMANLYVQSRIAFAMSRDGLYPKFFADVHEKYSNPHKALIFFAVITALVAAFSPFGVLGELPSMAALTDFMIISIIVLLFRVRYADVKRPFKCPAIYIVAPIAIGMCLYLISAQIYHEGQFLIQGKLFFIFFAVNFIAYFVIKGCKKGCVERKA